MDTFVEQLVQKKFDTTVKIKILLLTISMVLLVFLIFLLMLLPALQSFSFIVFLLEAGVIYGYWYIMTSFRTEFEYAFTNGELDVDKIIAKRKRKRLITVKIKDIEAMARVNGNEKNEFLNKSFKTVIDASSSPLSPNAFFISTHNDKLGHVKLIFEPDSRIIDLCKAAAPRKVFDK